MHRLRLIVSGLLLFGLSVQAAPADGNLPPRPSPSPKTEMFYAVAAHPDDEVFSWAYLEQLPATSYLVSVLATKGEGTESCLPAEDSRNRPGAEPQAPTPDGEPQAPTQAATFMHRLTGLNQHMWEDSTGPYKYEGPGSPVGEPDRGERHPLGDPWVGQGTEACKDARVASWHWYLDESYRIDGIGTDLEVTNDPEADDDYVGEFCPPGSKGAGRRWPALTSVGCVQVWADERGARVVFDLGNANWVDPPADWLDAMFTPEQVTAGLQAIRSNRSAWRLPLLPETGVFAQSLYTEVDVCPTYAYENPDHRVVQEAIRYTDQGLPLRAGALGCATDPFGDGATVRTVQADVGALIQKDWVSPVDGRRVGPVPVNYGWLLPEYVFPSCPDPFPTCFAWEIRSR